MTHAGRILVVDDQAINLRVVSSLLERQGYQVSCASGGEEALQACRTSIPDLILLDMMMPGMDGFSLLKAIKSDESLLRVPVICLTSVQDRDLLVQAFEAGAVDYVTKPFIAEELLARVGVHVGLKMTRDRLERVANERQELVNLVAHDLKNPLTSILFASDILVNNGVKPERVPRYLQMIHESASDALGYIRRYLESQAPGEEDAVVDAVADLDAALDWLGQRYELQCESKGLVLRISHSTSDARVQIEQLVLRQVAENLVTNALKYAAKGGELHLAAQAGAPGFWRLVAEDRGPGISAQQQRKLFKPFMRLTDGDPLDGVSSGLGLSLARHIVMSAGGQLFYEDREGGGARFVIELPAAE
ncbi:hybrid sensor histidine kinase/response regulator [Solilutibacter silvestris]|uniref:hybrid sensor histidine kinase/response regulator n=1 Tax=Solilutibacter silvestris TaxID=1645665 RepID=UPI0013FDC36F|nr:hybrid sensor histidine kinase/response regulator [Lysobacter silvestris]